MPISLNELYFVKIEIYDMKLTLKKKGMGRDKMGKTRYFKDMI